MMDVYKADQKARNTPVEIEPGALSEPEAAKFLRIGFRTLYELRREGRGPKHVRIGRSVRYPVHLLRKWLNDQAQGGAA